MINFINNILYIKQKRNYKLERHKLINQVQCMELIFIEWNSLRKIQRVHFFYSIYFLVFGIFHNKKFNLYLSLPSMPTKSKRKGILKLSMWKWGSPTEKSQQRESEELYKRDLGYYGVMKSSMILYNQGEHIIYGPNWDIFESERGAITNYVAGINQDCPRETKTYGHSMHKRFNLKNHFHKRYSTQPLG